ncbi:PRC-barrel domain-containing protein [Niveispirillum sp.]|uniref:PRC-barrel domain-containing protein n=1 Tax=Niveispirillum sp. TaxID=1917217 RepID=UPI001B4CF295|nr:PRC-barrel domain-containing protein [Niveispirillum sp.]MBP7337576.1 PRC-barrel domain-containing protein [Niveispirillum sp.]
MRTQLMSAAALTALLLGTGAIAQTVPPGTTEPVPPVPGTVQPGQAGEPPAAVMPERETAPEILAAPRPGIDRTSAEKLLGRTAVGADGKKLGEVEDVILNASSGDAEQLVISSGGFLGLGEKNIAVNIDDADLLAGNDSVKVRNLTTAQLDQMAEFEYGKDTRSLIRTDRP